MYVDASHREKEATAEEAIDTQGLTEGKELEGSKDICCTEMSEL